MFTPRKSGLNPVSLLLLGTVLGLVSIRFLRCQAFELLCVLLILLIPFRLGDKIVILGGSVNLDFMGIRLVLLTAYLSIIMLVVRNKSPFFKKFEVCVLFLMMCLVLTFRVSNIFLFYFFFEASLVPTIVLILG